MLTQRPITDYIDLEILKRLYCAVTLFLLAGFFHGFGKAGELPPSEYWGFWNLAYYSLLVIPSIIGWFILPRFLGNTFRWIAFLRAPAGYAIATFLCAVSFLFIVKISTLGVESYSDLIATSIADALIYAPIGTVLIFPIWLFGACLAQCFWLVLVKLCQAAFDICKTFDIDKQKKH